MLLALLGGAAMWVAFDPLFVPLMTLPGVALLVLSTRGSVPSGMLAGLLWGLAFFLPLTSWARISVGEPLPWIVLASLQAVFLAVLGGFLARLWSRDLPAVVKILGAAALYTAFEIARSTIPWGGFPWGKLAYAHTGTPLVRLAPYISSVGLTFVAALLGIILAVAILYYRRLIVSLSLGLSIVVAIVLSIAVPLPTSSPTFLKVGWVQGGPPGDKEDTRALNVTRAHLDESKNLRGDMDVLVWPESASDHDIRTNERAWEMVQEAASDHGVPVLLGTQEYLENGRYNDVVVVDGDRIVDRYSKSAPVPFGEYIPNREFFAKLSDAVDLVSVDMLAGEGPATVDLPSGVRLAVPICFEIAVDHVVRDAVLDGGQAFIVPVNTASFGDSAESLQQLRQTVLRSVEYSRASIQVGTQGVSAVVAPNGAITELTDQWVPASGISRIPLRDNLTLSARFGQAVEIVMAGAGLAVALTSVVWRRRKDTNETPRHRSHL